VSPLPKLLALLKPGDIVTHMFAPPPNSIIDDTGHILPEVTAARRRASGSTSAMGAPATCGGIWPNALLQAGFLPDTFLHGLDPESRAAQVIDFPNVMSKFLMLECRSTRWSRALPSMRRARSRSSAAAAR